MIRGSKTINMAPWPANKVSFSFFWLLRGVLKKGCNTFFRDHPSATCMGQAEAYGLDLWENTSAQVLGGALKSKVNFFNVPGATGCHLWILFSLTHLKLSSTLTPTQFESFTYLVTIFHSGQNSIFNLLQAKANVHWILIREMWFADIAKLSCHSLDCPAFLTVTIVQSLCIDKMKVNQNIWHYMWRQDIWYL